MSTVGMTKTERMRFHRMHSYHRHKVLKKKDPEESKRKRSERNKRYQSSIRAKKARNEEIEVTSKEGEKEASNSEDESAPEETPVTTAFADDHTDRDDVESTEREGEFILNEEGEGEVVRGVIDDDDDDDDDGEAVNDDDGDDDDDDDDDDGEAVNDDDEDEDDQAVDEEERKTSLFDSKGRLRLKESKKLLESVFESNSSKVAAHFLSDDNIKLLSQNTQKSLLKRLQKQVSSSITRTSEEQRASHRQACFVLRSQSSKKEYVEITKMISVAPSGLSLRNKSNNSSNSNRKISSETTMRRERTNTLQQLGFLVQIGQKNSALRWVDPAPLLSLYESEICLFCTAVDGVEEKKGAEGTGRHPNNAYLWALELGSQNIRIQSPFGTLLFARGLKEYLKDSKDTDSVLQLVVERTRALKESVPRLKFFHSGDAFELRHEIGIHSKIFPSWNWKTCFICLRQLKKGPPRTTQEEDSKKCKEDVTNLIALLPELSEEVKKRVRRYVSNIRYAGQNPNCFLPQSMINNTIPDILHLEINTLRIFLIELCLQTFRSECLLSQQIWSDLKSEMPTYAAELFQLTENYTASRSAGTPTLNLHVLGKVAANILRVLPSALLRCRLRFFYRTDRRNNPLFRKKFNVFLIVFMLLIRIFFICIQTTIDFQDQAYNLISSWPHSTVTSATELLQADCKLLKRIIRGHLDSEIVTDTIYQLIYSVPIKNIQLRASNTVIGSCQLQAAEHSGGRAAYLRRTHSNNSKKEGLHNADGSVLRLHFLHSLRKRNMQPSIPPVPLKLLPDDLWMKLFPEWSCI